MGGVGQADFGGGIFRGRKAPGNSVYDAVNALLNDERELFRRGGAAYLTDLDAGGNLLGLLNTETSFGRRTAMWDSGGLLYALDASGDPYALQSTQKVGAGAQQATMEQGPPFQRPVAIGPWLVFRRDSVASGSQYAPGVLVWAGARKGYYATGTATRTNGSKAVTGAGTAWSANVEAGQLFYGSNTSRAIGIIAAVGSDTALTLRDVWDATGGSSAYEIADVADIDYSNEVDPLVDESDTPWCIGAVGSPPRFLVGWGNRLFFAPETGSMALQTDAEAAASTKATSYHELPQGARILALGDLGGYAFVFTDDGIWTVGNMELDAFDAFGNIQHKLELMSQEMLLWGNDLGIVSYQGQLLVPCRDDLYAMSVGSGPVAVTEAVRPMYRDYVEAGYRPGMAEVHRGHLLLPIMSDSVGDTLQDVLVVRLDLPGSRGRSAPAWTRWADQAAGSAYARAEDGKVYGVSVQRITDLTDCWNPSAANDDDADGTDHELQVTTQDYASGQIPHTFKGARVAMELVDGAATNPTFEVEYASGAVDATFTSAGTRGEGDGEVPEMFRFARRARAIRLRITTANAAARAVLRSVEVFWKDRGRS